MEAPGAALPVPRQHLGHRADAMPPGLGLLQEQQGKDHYSPSQNFLLQEAAPCPGVPAVTQPGRTSPPGIHVSGWVVGGTGDAVGYRQCYRAGAAPQVSGDLACTSVDRSREEGEQSGHACVRWEQERERGAQDCVRLRKEQDLQLGGREREDRGAHAAEHRLESKAGEVRGGKAWGLGC